MSNIDSLERPEMHIKQVITLLEAKAEKAGSVSELARDIGVSKQFLSRVMRQEVHPSAKILEHIGIEEESSMRVVTYRRKRD